MARHQEAVAWCARQLLRTPASLLHNAALASVFVSRCAKAPLGSGHRCALCRVKAAGVMQSGLRWSRSHSRLRALGVVVALWHQSGAARFVVGQWPAASHGVCPRPPLCFAAVQHHPCALVCPSAPPLVGAPSARAPTGWLCYGLSSWSRQEYWVYRRKDL
jgi:hypothetical protein